MTKEEVIRHRQFCENAKFKARNADGDLVEYLAPFVIVCDNSLYCKDDRQGSVVWDDANEKFVEFRYNGPGSYYNSHSNAMTFGNKPAVPGTAIVVDYGEIQNFRIELNEDIFEHITTALTAMTEEQKKHVKDLLFNKTDMEQIIKRKRKISYVTQEPKDSELSKKNFSDVEEYRATVRPGSSI